MASALFTQEEKKAIVSSIVEAEKNTSGEIQIHIENQCANNVLDRAAEIFSILKMNKTKLRNGVLFYVAMEDHKFAILGDAGINAVVPPDFWDSIKQKMTAKFKEGSFADGICEGIYLAGQQLKKHFPYKTGDKNELSDEISFGKN